MGMEPGGDGENQIPAPNPSPSLHTNLKLIPSQTEVKRV